MLLPACGSIISRTFLPGLKWAQIPLHAAIEALGAFAAITLAVFLLIMRKHSKDYAIILWISCGLIAMGILDIFHSFVPPGNSFVWLHSISVLCGGLFFAVIILPNRIIQPQVASLMPGFVAAFAIILGTFSIYSPDAFPVMVTEGIFTSGAISINVLGGVLFIIAALFLLFSQGIENRSEGYLFAALALLFGTAGIIFNVSVLWDADWWLWHVLRLIAYLICLSFVFINFKWAHEELQEANVSLKESIIENLRQQNQEFTESANILASAANELSSSVQQLASSATETAASVGEISATIEEVNQTAQLSSEKARFVSESAQNAETISKDGDKATDDTAEGMRNIREQMEVIGESIMSLNEQSQAIGEIVATVDDIADQSNLLAVNAAIETARANEHGKGFSVVAQEIKGLAEQSKQATTRVRSILNDIQKATSNAVMATEQGSKTVEEGVKQSAQAGKSILALSNSIGEAAQAATQIAASSQQQLVGMEQVTTAMESVKESCNQNATSAKQLESTAQYLSELGQKLKGLAEGALYSVNSFENRVSKE